MTTYTDLIYSIVYHICKYIYINEVKIENFRVTGDCHGQHIIMSTTDRNVNHLGRVTSRKRVKRVNSRVKTLHPARKA